MTSGDVNTEAGFIRLTTEEVRGNLREILKSIMCEGQRIVLQQQGEEVAAIIPIAEFERLEYLKNEIKPSAFNPDEYEYYEDETGIHCIRLAELEAEFEEILFQVMVNNEFFGLMPPQKSANLEFFVVSPGAILMNINNFWVSEYWMSENQRLGRRIE
jgi:prevent-host-death family protein